MRGKVKKVIDGDTILLEDGTFVRLAEVRAPERNQRGFKKAKEVLESLVEGKSVTIKKVGVDRGRVIGEVRVDSKSVNISMKRRGYTNKGK